MFEHTIFERWMNGFIVFYKENAVFASYQLFLSVYRYIKTKNYNNNYLNIDNVTYIVISGYQLNIFKLPKWAVIALGYTQTSSLIIVRHLCTDTELKKVVMVR